MAGERVAGPSTGQITSGIERGALVLQTISFVRQQLPAWRDDPDRPRKEAEYSLNLQLCKFLNSRARDDFPMVCFNTEEPQTGRSKVDISATPAKAVVIEAQLHTIYDLILVLEGKRLPAPSKDREKEYVTGYARKNGGIQRFKLGLHGAKFDVAAMIGYVQERSPRHWHSTITKWISELASGKDNDDCAWNKSETLGPLGEDIAKRIASCLSTHSRTGGSSSNRIEIHHLWIAI